MKNDAINVDLSQCQEKKCPNCEKNGFEKPSVFFEMKHIIKKVPGIFIGKSGFAEIAVSVLVCSQCGEIDEESKKIFKKEN